MRSRAILAAIVYLACLGCHVNKKPCITAISLNNDCHWGQETGIPFYLPKPLLIVSKNFRNIEEAKVGLTDSAPIPEAFDDQSKYADVNARTNFNFDGGDGNGETQSMGVTSSATKSEPHLYSQSGAPMTPTQTPSDGLGPDTFYTYHIVFVPDLTQKYGLRLRGGPGEIRAAMNLVNGWQYTGMGPYYSKDSSSAQNILAGGISARLGGQAAQDVLSSVADLAKAFPTGAETQSGSMFDTTDPRIQKLSETFTQLPVNAEPMYIPDFAEIHVYEPSLGPDGMMTWSEIACCAFNRAYLGVKRTEKEYFAPQAINSGTNSGNGAPVQPAGFVNDTSDAVTQSAIAAVFGVNPNSAAIQPAGGTLQSGGGLGDSATSGVNQVNVTCPNGCQKPCCEKSSRHFSLFNFSHGRDKAQPKVERKLITVTPTPVSTGTNASTVANQDLIRRLLLQTSGVEGQVQSVGGLTNDQDQSAVLNNSLFNQPVLNQPTLNQPLIVPVQENPN